MSKGMNPQKKNILSKEYKPLAFVDALKKLHYSRIVSIYTNKGKKEGK